jgi:hypothetical protein
MARRFEVVEQRPNEKALSMALAPMNQEYPSTPPFVDSLKGLTKRVSECLPVVETHPIGAEALLGEVLRSFREQQVLLVHGSVKRRTGMRLGSH